MSDKEMCFQVPPKTFNSPKHSDLTDRPRNEPGSELQTVVSSTEKAQVPNVLRRYCGIFSLQWLAAGIFGDWHAAVGDILWQTIHNLQNNEQEDDI